MKRYTRFAVLIVLISLFIVLISLFVVATSLNAQWINNGVPVCTAGGEQENNRIISDGSGGAIIVWEDNRVSGTEIYAQRIDAYGYTLWTIDGVNISELAGNQVDPQLASDGAGGAIIVYASDRAGDWDIIAQRIDANGTIVWSTGGVLICMQANSQQYPQIVTDGSGGAIIAWEDHRGVAPDIYAQRIDENGFIQWTVGGEAVCIESQDQNYPKITSNGYGGAIIVWQDERSGDADIYVQRINGDGTVAWTSNGVVVCSETSVQVDPEIIADDAGGAIIVWSDFRSAIALDIYAQKIDSTGAGTWYPMGRDICTNISQQYSPELTSDGSGGAIIIWSDSRNGPYDIYAQWMTTDGMRRWTTDGIEVVTAANEQEYPKIIADGAGGAIVTWQDARYGGYVDVYAQRIDSDGNQKWKQDGVAVSEAPRYQYTPDLVSNGSRGAIIAWSDQRNGATSTYDIYAQSIDRFGYWGNPAPSITNVSDVPNDQGGRVMITWDRSRLDEFPQETVTHYSIWRSIAGPEAMGLMAGGIGGAELSAIGIDFEGPSYRFETLGGTMYAWEWITNMESHWWEEYAYTCETLYDSAGTNDGMHYFVIAAHTSDQFVYWNSEPDSGYSVDNLAPAQPQELTGEQSYVPEGLTLAWAPNTELDLSHYNVYRGPDEMFVPGPGNLIASPSDTTAFDSDWWWDSGFYYKVAAVDYHDNESCYALLGPIDITGEDVPETPHVTYLTQNYPNPFNPITRIIFGLSESGHVRLRIYDASGRLVRTLFDEYLEAGRYDETWDGKDSAETSVASGVYFFSLTTNTFKETKKMVLLR